MTALMTLGNTRGRIARNHIQRKYAISMGMFRPRPDQSLKKWQSRCAMGQADEPRSNMTDIFYLPAKAAPAEVLAFPLGNAGMAIGTYTGHCDRQTMGGGRMTARGDPNGGLSRSQQQHRSRLGPSTKRYTDVSDQGVVSDSLLR